MKGGGLGIKGLCVKGLRYSGSMVKVRVKVKCKRFKVGCNVQK